MTSRASNINLGSLPCGLRTTLEAAGIAISRSRYPPSPSLYISRSLGFSWFVFGPTHNIDDATPAQSLYKYQENEGTGLYNLNGPDSLRRRSPALPRTGREASNHPTSIIAPSLIYDLCWTPVASFLVLGPRDSHRVFGWFWSSLRGHALVDGFFARANQSGF